MWNDSDDDKDKISDDEPNSISTSKDTTFHFDNVLDKDDDVYSEKSYLSQSSHSSFAPIKVPLKSNFLTISKNSDTNIILKSNIQENWENQSTFIRDVKQAHECQEFGETQEFKDDIEYIMDGLNPNKALSTRCLSAMSLLTKCLNSGFRMNLRAHSSLTRVFNSLADSPKYPALGLCVASLFVLISRDRLTFDIDGPIYDLLLSLNSNKNNLENKLNDIKDQSISIENKPSTLYSYRKCSQGSKINNLDRLSCKEFSNLQLKIQQLYNKFGHNISLRGNDVVGNNLLYNQIEFEDITVENLALEALISLFSRKDVDLLKNDLKELNGLDYILTYVCNRIEEINEEIVETESLNIKRILQIEYCLKVIENVTYLNDIVQSHVINFKYALLITQLCKCLFYCAKWLPNNKITEEKGKVLKDSPGFIIYNCILSILRVLVNVTHDNDYSCLKTGQQSNMMQTLMSCLLNMHKHLPLAERFDLIVLSLGLLVNLVEHSRSNLNNLLTIKSLITFEQYPDNMNTNCSALISLGMLFSIHHDAAKMFEEEHDAELEEKERKREELCDVGTSSIVLNKNNAGMDKILWNSGHDYSGEWTESALGGGLEWVPYKKDEDIIIKDDYDKDLKNKNCDTVSNTKPTLTPNKHASMFALSDQESFNKALNKAGQHMEDSIISAYAALLIGCIVRHNIDLAEDIRDFLPDCSFESLTRILKKFLDFMNITNASRTSCSDNIMKVINVLESC